jgi:hypothetical protein
VNWTRPPFGLAGDILEDVTDEVRSVTVRRGRSRELERYQAGAATVVLDSQDRKYDPSYKVTQPLALVGTAFTTSQLVTLITACTSSPRWARQRSLHQGRWLALSIWWWLAAAAAAAAMWLAAAALVVLSPTWVLEQQYQVRKRSLLVQVVPLVEAPQQV